MTAPLFPNVTVQLTGEDGNAFFIIGRVSAALSQGGADKDQISAFQKEAMSGNYDNVLTTCMKYGEVT